ncbi:MAG: glycosyltransferase family A protein [Elusimicrobiota bacterium]|nr:glycosyltransferase family A protein [Elusimicrobiota bacterium]
MTAASLDVVIVARNEGKIFEKCCASVEKAVAVLAERAGIRASVVYVDSYSTDGSVAVASRRGFRIARPPDWYYNCANGRTAGYLLTSGEFVMMLDGDMELAKGWLADGLAFLESRPDAGGVAGVRDDMRLAGDAFIRIPDYHRISAPVQGVGDDVGGAFLFRRAALDAAGGFEPAVVPEEDFVLYAQIKRKGWELYRIDKPMIVHWDTKVSTPAAVIKHLMFSRKALVPGVIFRHALLYTDWWPQLLRFKRDLLVHALWLLAVAFARPAVLPLTATAVYLVLIWTQKRDPLRTAGALVLRTAYLANFLVGFLLGRPALEFGVQHHDKYKETVRRLNPS